MFFEELEIPAPDVYMGRGGGTHAQQTAKIMVGFEELCQTEKPDCVLVVGDVNSTLACSVVARNLHIPVAHVEAGLRSGGMAMPEEVNRVVTDSISNWFFVTEPSGVENLYREGKAKEAVHYVGHVMVDNLLHQAEKLARWDTSTFSTAQFKADHSRYGVVTLHRPSKVDDAASFTRLSGALRDISRDLPLLFAVHPRTRGNLSRFRIDLGSRVTLTGPLAYMEFLNLWKDAAVVLTDSGGLQEETPALAVPCVTLRENTERPITVSEGTNVVAGTDPARMVEETARIVAGNHKRGRRPALWDGKAAERIVAVLARELAA